MTTNVTTGPASPSMRPFFVIWSGQAGSLLGSQLVQFALVWWLTQATGSATILALASLAALLPQILIGPIAGALVDRWSRRTVMIAADAAIALATLALAVLFWLKLATLWHIYALLLIRSLGAAFHWPAMQASTTLLVPEQQLSRIAGLNQTLAGMAGIFIPPLGALAIEILPSVSPITRRILNKNEPTPPFLAYYGAVPIGGKDHPHTGNRHLLRPSVCPATPVAQGPLVPAVVKAPYRVARCFRFGRSPVICCSYRTLGRDLARLGATQR